MKVFRIVLSAVVSTMLVAPGASAQLFKSWYACGGNSSTFDTCAAVALTIDGTNVSVAVKNLSGTTYGTTTTWANTVFTAVGFEWADASKALTALTPQVTTMSGATILNKYGQAPSAWLIKNDKQVGGGVKLDLVGLSDNGIDDGIVSELSDFVPQTTDTKNFWLSGETAGWVTFGFQVYAHSLVQSDLDGVGLLVKGQNGEGNDDSLQLICDMGSKDTADICTPTTVVPEPISMALLGTGLFGIGIARRRRNNRHDADLVDA